jgi:hypothetical protein
MLRLVGRFAVDETLKSPDARRSISVGVRDHDYRGRTGIEAALNSGIEDASKPISSERCRPESFGFH